MLKSLGKARRMSQVGQAIAGFAVCAAVLGASAPAMAQETDVRVLLDRLERMERDIRSLNLQVSKGEVPPSLATDAGPGSAGDMSSPNVARLEVRLTQLESEVRAAIGRAEEITFQINQLRTELGGRLDKLVQDVDFRLGVLEQRAGISPGVTPPSAGGTPAASAYPAGTSPGSPEAPVLTPPSASPPPPTEPGSLGTISQRDLDALTSGGAGAGAGASPAPSAASAGGAASAAPAAAAAAQAPLSPQEQYDQARGLLLQARYDEAEQALTAFVGEHGDSPLAGNARYWLGETYYVRADYVRAAEVFLDGFQKNPDSPKAPDTLLKLGMSLANLDKNREACAAFGKLASDYPDAPSNIQRLLARERQKNGCK